MDFVAMYVSELCFIDSYGTSTTFERVYHTLSETMSVRSTLEIENNVSFEEIQAPVGYTVAYQLTTPDADGYWYIREVKDDSKYAS